MSAVFDYGRRERIGLPESVFCESKDTAALNALLEELAKRQEPILLTRLSEEKRKSLDPALASLLDYDPISRTAFLGGTLPSTHTGVVAVVTAGTGDRAVAGEAERTLKYLGVSYESFHDIGVAALWRVQARLEEINRTDVIIAAAGMDAAITTVLGGLTQRPLIALPTSVGYGAAAQGMSALQSMLCSCAPGVLVVNIDNGYGAACAAFRIIRALKKG